MEEMGKCLGLSVVHGKGVCQAARKITAESKGIAMLSRSTSQRHPTMTIQFHHGQMRHNNHLLRKQLQVFRSHARPDLLLLLRYCHPACSL